MRILEQHKNTEARTVYREATGVNPLHLFGDKYYTAEYITWLEDTLNETIVLKIENGIKKQLDNGILYTHTVA